MKTRRVLFTVLCAALLFGCTTPPAPLATPTMAKPIAKVEVSPTPFQPEKSVSPYVGIDYTNVPSSLGGKGVFELARRWVASYDIELDANTDLAMIVEPIPGASCRGQPCVAEVYLDSRAILMSSLMKVDVRNPQIDARITLGDVCSILDLSNNRGYLDWRQGKSPQSALFIGWDDEQGVEHLGALGWNWHPTEWVGNTMYDLDLEDFWGAVDNLPCKGG